MTPEQKYMNDPLYHRVVETLTHLIIDCKMTPGEVREAAMLASIHYEMRNVRIMELKLPFNSGIEMAMTAMEAWREQEQVG